MAKDDHEKDRLDKMSAGAHLGGTKFGQTPGTNDANPAQPKKQSPDDKKKTENDG